MPSANNFGFLDPLLSLSHNLSHNLSVQCNPVNGSTSGPAKNGTNKRIEPLSEVTGRCR